MHLQVYGLTHQEERLFPVYLTKLYILPTLYIGGMLRIQIRAQTPRAEPGRLGPARAFPR